MLSLAGADIKSYFGAFCFKNSSFIYASTVSPSESLVFICARFPLTFILLILMYLNIKAAGSSGQFLVMNLSSRWDASFLVTVKIFIGKPLES